MKSTWFLNLATINNKCRSEGGFTLIELLVVIIIIGILSVIALPAMLSQGAKARQSEAKAYLGAINRAQQAYLVENLVFATSIDTLGIGIPNNTNNYSYSFIVVPTQSSIIANPRSQTETKGYAGATTLFIDRAVLKTIICETMTAGSNGLKVPIWDNSYSTLACDTGMQQIEQ